MKSLKIKCSQCQFFSRYYYVNNAKLKSTSYGLCARQGVNVKTNNRCEESVPKPKPCPLNSNFIQSRLDELLIEITAIRTILEVEINETKEL